MRAEWAGGPALNTDALQCPASETSSDCGDEGVVVSRIGWLHWGFGVAWLALVIASIVIVWNYGGEPGAAGDSPAAWPDGMPLARADDSPCLILFAHPHCPCTSATVSELERALGSVQQDVVVHAVFWVPEHESAEWAHGRLWDVVSRLPGAERHIDPGGVLAWRFGARTSGHVVLYGADGVLRYSGGVTISRGHEGGNLGRVSLARAIDGVPAQHEPTPVFGCALDVCAPEAFVSATETNQR